MTSQDRESPGQEPATRQVTESEAWSVPGVGVLVLGVGLLLAGTALLAFGIAQGGSAGPTALIGVSILLLIAGELAVHGVMSVVAGEARAVQLFGRYRG